MPAKPYRLEPSFVEKVWGTTSLRPFFPNQERKIGEVHFAPPGGARLPLMVKFLFVTEDLSVQVHPGGDEGKTEVWYVLRAEPKARIALGPAEPITREKLRQASESGEIEGLLRWIPVKPGETYFIPAGTIHAAGRGLTVCEIQQNQDITYRLYDYGRDRELHLDQAVAAASLQTHPGATTGRVACQYFCTEPMRLSTPITFQPEGRESQFLIVLKGEGAIAGHAFKPGQVWHVPADAEPFLLAALVDALVLRAWVPPRENS